MHIKKYIYIIFGICLFTGFLPMHCLFAQVPEDMDSGEQQNITKGEDSQKADEFKYQLEGRPDPFEPFIRPQVATTAEPDEIVEEDKVLTGMQLFEPGQLTLVAIMSAGGGKLAMVEDVTGKGYIIKEGVLIGRRGVVSRITDDQVLITETARTRANREIVSTVVMRLNKEGD